MSAKITDAGRDYLARMDGSDPPIPRQANVPVTQQFVDDLVAAGGVLRFPGKRWDDPDSVDYERRAELAQRHSRAPAGKQIVTAWVEHELEVRLVDMPQAGRLGASSRQFPSLRRLAATTQPRARCEIDAMTTRSLEISCRARSG